jgi:anti-sigma regulatory factor (Ser/Thr protein kinase)
MIAHRLFAWLPAQQHKPLLQRLLIVWAAALLIAAATWIAHLSDGLPHRFDVSLVYSYAISTFIWMFTDLSRFVFNKVLRAQAPHYWPPAWRASLMLGIGIPLGYMLGTLVGDAYAGWSTWDLWHLNPIRFASLLVTSVAISAAFVLFFYQRAKAQTLANEIIQTQLMLLQSQLEPHMLFNTLANLRTLVQNDPQRALHMLDRLIDFLRVTLSGSRQATQPLQQEFDRLADYLNLMQLRMGTRLSFALNLPDHLVTQAVPSLILQPLVENSIRHGLEPQVQAGHIEVSAMQENDQLVLRVQDTGQCVQLPPPPTLTHNNPTSASYGLQHVQQRLHTLYGERAKMQLNVVQPHGLCVTLQWPMTPT